MASLTVLLVVSGPGVNSGLSFTLDGLLDIDATPSLRAEEKTITDKVKDIEIARIARRLGPVSLGQRFGQNHWHHLFVAPAVRAQLAFKQRQIVMRRRAADHPIAAGKHEQVANPVGR